MSENGIVGEFHYIWDERYYTLELSLWKNLNNPYYPPESMDALLGKESMIKLRNFLDQKIKECP